MIKKENVEMKKLIICLFVLAMVLCLSACGGDSGKSVDLDKLAKELLDSGAFSDTLSEPAEGVAAKMYNFEVDDVVKCVLYTGTGATAEEIFLAQTTGSEAAARVQSLCQTRVQNQQLAFENYVPTELPKLQSAVIGTAGSYVVLVVSNDSPACQAIVEKYMN